MSHSTERRPRYLWIGIFVVLLLVTAVLLCTSFFLSMSLQETTQAVNAVATQAQAAQSGAETAIARVDDLATRVAQASVPTPTRSPTPTVVTPAPVSHTVPLAGGIGIITDGLNAAYYPIDDWRAYRNYQDFESYWPGDSPAMIWLVLQETEKDSGKWQAFRAVNADVAANPTGWRNYTLLAQLSPAAGDVPDLLSGQVVLALGPEQAIVGTKTFAIDPDADLNLGESLIGFQEDTGINLETTKRRTLLLLADRSAGKRPILTLVAIFPETGAGDDPWVSWPAVTFPTYPYFPLWFPWW